MRFGTGLVLTAVIALGGPAVAATHGTKAPAMQQTSKQQLGLVKIGDQTALRLTAAENLSAEQRANRAREAILTALRADGVDTLGPFDIQEAVAIDMQGDMPAITLNGRPIVKITPNDTQIHGMTADELAERWEQAIQNALAALQLSPETRVANLEERFTVAVTGVGEPIMPEARMAANDERIAAGVRNTMITEEAFRQAGLADSIRVDVVDGVVTLWGDADPAMVQEELIERIQELPGVKSVVNMVGTQGRPNRRERS